MSIEQEIWDEFKELSERDIISDRVSYGEAKQYFGIRYENPIGSLSRINGNQYIQNNADYKIEKALREENINWDEVKKLYPKSEIQFKYNYAPKYPEPKWRTKKENREIENLLLTNYGSIEGLNELFLSEPEARKYLKDKRWADNIICPYCGCQNIYILTAQRQGYQCGDYKNCHKKFSLTVSTIFENTKIGLNKWLQGIHLLSSNKTSKISTPQLGRVLGITQVSAWRMTHKIKSAVNDPIFEDIRNGLFNKKLIV